MPRGISAPLKYAYGNVTFGTPSGEWATYKIGTETFDGLPLDRQRQVFARQMAVVEALEADFQILRLSRQWSLEDYCDQARRLPTTASPDVLHRYVDEQRVELDGRVGSSQPELYFSASLAEPKGDLASYLTAAFESPGDRWRDLKAAWTPKRSQLASSNLERLRNTADRRHGTLTDYLRDVREATIGDIEWIARRAFCRGLGEPVVDYPQGPSALGFERNNAALLTPAECDLARLMSEGEIHRHGTYFHIEHEHGSSWQTFLVAGQMPDVATFPGDLELMFRPAESLPFPIDLSLNARFIPNEVAINLVKKRIQDADQIAEAEHEGDQGVSDQAREREHLARDLLRYLQSPSRPPMLDATLAVCVASTKGPEDLANRVRQVRAAFGTVKLHRPAGIDQLQLFFQFMPGQPSRVKGYSTPMTPEQIAATVPTATHTVGSSRGFYLGHTLSHSRQPVLHNINEGSESNDNVAILNVGSLGKGKTIGLGKLYYEAFLLGGRIVDVDPKGDHTFHLLDEVAADVEIIDIRDNQRMRGMLDPLRVAPDVLRQDAAVSFLSELLPRRSEASWESAIVRAVDSVLRNSANPTCREVVHALSEGDAVDRAVANHLLVFAKSGLTQLGFADPDVRLPEFGSRRVVYMPIRDLPSPDARTARSDYTMSERVGEQLLRLIALFSLQIMGRYRDELTVFGYDEGHRFIDDPVMRMVLMSGTRMGRSERIIPVLGSQLVTDTMTDRESMENLIGETYLYGMKSASEAERGLKMIGLDPTEKRIEQVMGFEEGRCLYRDHAGRVEAIQVDVASRLLQGLLTTPETEHTRALATA